MLTVKRYLRVNCLENELAVDDPDSNELRIKCLKCKLLVMINATGRGSYEQRIEAHVTTSKHKKAKNQRSISSMFSKTRKLNESHQ